jgi:hypothetical protein
MVHGSAEAAVTMRLNPEHVFFAAAQLLAAQVGNGKAISDKQITATVDIAEKLIGEVARRQNAESPTSVLPSQPAGDDATAQTGEGAPQD